MNHGSITVHDLSYAFRDNQHPALDHLSAIIRPGAITGLVGPDGAGKTTLIRLMAALMLPTSGDIRVFGFDTRNDPNILHTIIGYMPQKFGLYEDLSVIQNLRLYADLHGLTGHARIEAFQRLLDFTGLEPFQKRLAGRLSGGMKQKLGLACTLIRKPQLLLLDEPSVGVDPVSRRELWSMVRELVTEEMVVIWSTAYLDEAEQCDEVLLLNEGRLIFGGPPTVLTGRVTNRCFQIRNITTNRRKVLARALRQDEIQDGIVQGEHVRIVLRPNASLPEPHTFAAGPAAQFVSVSPRFEDAFVDILGGGPGGNSVLAASMTQVKDEGSITVAANGLTKRFGDFTAVENITFSIQRGEIFGLLGPNGAGKSTTFKMMCGLLRPSAGTGRVVGLDLQKAPGKARSRLGYMAQKFSLYGDLSTLQNLEFFSGVYGLAGTKQKDTVARMIEIFSLQPYLKVSAKELPLGFKQRLALSCAVMHEPAVLFLDEPTSGVDPITRREFWTHINGLVERGVTVLVTTHFMDEAEYCDRIALIYRGRMIAGGSPDDLKKSTKSERLPDPTLEEAFISLIREWDKKNQGAR